MTNDAISGMGAFILTMVFIGPPFYLLSFGFLCGFGAAVAQGGREDHSMWRNVGAIASTGLGLLVPAWQLDDSPFAGPLPTLIGAAVIWALLRTLTSPGAEGVP